MYDNCCEDNLCGSKQVIFVVRNIDGWLHHNKLFSFKMKKSIVARYEDMNSLKIPSKIDS